MSSTTVLLNTFTSATSHLFGGGVLLALAGLRWMRRFAPSSLLGWVIVLFALYAVATLSFRGYSLYAEEIQREVIRTENAKKRERGCGKMPEELQGVQVFDAECENYAYITRTSAETRAWTTLMGKLPKPENVPKVIMSSAENSIYATAILLGLGFLVFSLLQPVREKSKDKALKYRQRVYFEDLAKQVKHDINK